MSLARPKSQIFTMLLSDRRMFRAARSLWIHCEHTHTRTGAHTSRVCGTLRLYCFHFFPDADKSTSWVQFNQPENPPTNTAVGTCSAQHQFGLSPVCSDLLRSFSNSFPVAHFCRPLLIAWLVFTVLPFWRPGTPSHEPPGSCSK